MKTIPIRRVWDDRHGCFVLINDTAELDKNFQSTEEERSLRLAADAEMEERTVELEARLKQEAAIRAASAAKQNMPAPASKDGRKLERVAKLSAKPAASAAPPLPHAGREK